MENRIKVFTGSFITVNRIADLLQKDSIKVLIRNNEESARLAGFGSTGDNVELFIDKKDVPNAKKILQEFE